MKKHSFIKTPIHSFIIFYVVEIKWTYQFCPKVGEPLDWESICEAYDWVKALKDVPQDPIFHAEGDVLVHTRMVLEALINLESWQKLNETHRSKVFLATLMHDIAKPRYTEKIDGRIRSPRHAKVGAKMARSLIFRKELGKIPFEIREEIVALVYYHGLPLWFYEKENPEQYVLRASLQCNLSHLATLAEADVRGRICNDQHDLLDRVELFRMFIDENQCSHQPFPFKNDLTRFIYFQKEDSSPFYEPFDDTEFEVILLSGIPGSGKNTWIANNNIGNYEQVCLDDIRRALRISPKDNQGKIIQTAQTLAKTFLRKKQPFIWNATNLQASRRKKLIDLFTTYKAKVKIVYIETDYQILLQRNQTRDFPIPTKVLEQFIDRVEVPKLHEAHEVEFFVE